MENSFDNAQELFEKASNYSKEEKYKESLEYYELAAKMFNAIGDHNRAVGNCFYNSSIVFSKMGNTTGAIKCCIKAAEQYNIAGYPQDEGDCYYRIGAQYEKLKDEEHMVEAYKKAFDIYVEIPNHEDIANTARELASYYMDKDDDKMAGYYYIKCIKAYKEIKEFEQAADCYTNIAWISNKLGNYEQAYKCCAAGANFYDKLGIVDKDTVANCYANMADACDGLGHHTDAINAYLKAIKICANTGNKGKAAFSYFNLAKLYAKISMFPKAISAIDYSIALYKEVRNEHMVELAEGLKARYAIGNGSDPFDEAFNEKASGIFTDARKAQDDDRHADAIRLYAQYIKMNIDRGNKEDVDVGHAYYNSANAYRSLGKIDDAIKNYKLAKAIYLSVGSESDAKDCDDAIQGMKDGGSSDDGADGVTRMALDKISNLIDKGLECQNNDDDKGAIEAYLEAIKIYSVIGIEDENLGTVYNNISNAYSSLDRYDEALSYCEKARVVYEKIPDVSDLRIANCYYNLGNRYYRREDYAKAKKYYEKALLLYKKIDKQDSIKRCNDLISKCNYHL